MNDWGNIAIVTRVGGSPHPLFFDSWSRLLFEGMRTEDRIMAPAMRLPAHRAGNAIVKAFLSEGWLQECDTLCFVDDDHVFKASTLERLRCAEAGRPYDVLGAMYSARGAGRWPVVMRKSDKWTAEQPKYGVFFGFDEGDVVEVDAVGLGFTMIRRSLLERMTFPYFQYRDDADGTEYTEDVVFCWQAQALGGRLAVHTGVAIGHIDNLVLTPSVTREEASDPKMDAQIPGTSNGTDDGRSVSVSVESVRLGTGHGIPD